MMRDHNVKMTVPVNNAIFPGSTLDICLTLAIPFAFAVQCINILQNWKIKLSEAVTNIKYSAIAQNKEIVAAIRIGPAAALACLSDEQYNTIPIINPTTGIR
jgi:hypothetical protein